MAASTSFVIVVATVAALLLIATCRSRARYSRYRRRHVDADRIRKSAKARTAEADVAAARVVGLH